MGARKMSTRVMIGITQFWMSVKIAALMTKHTLLSPTVTLIQQTQEALTNSLVLSEDERMAQIRKAMHRLDDRHDAFNRALDNLLVALIDKTNDPTHKETLQRIREELFPEGMQVNIQSWTEEAASCHRLETMLKAKSDLRTELAKISINDGTSSKAKTALDWAYDIVKIGQQMETNLQEYATLTAKAKATSTPSSTATPTEAQSRNQFFQLVRLLRESTSIALGVDSDDYVLFWEKYNTEYSKTTSNKGNSQGDTAESNSPSPESNDNTSTPDTTNATPANNPTSQS